MNKFILTALVLSTTLTAFITPAQATQTHTDAVIGTVSATASTLTESGKSATG
ncbi:hypothetical protein QNH14_21035 [Apirhabdus apintestini]|nr:hypothetical protein QNH14_21035 [Enterobacteriaceae bacterium CA-0114]